MNEIGTSTPKGPFLGNILVTSRLFEAYLACPTKCFLRSMGTAAAKNPVAAWLAHQDSHFRRKAGLKLQTCPDIVLDQVVETDNVEAQIHAVQTIRLKGKLRSIPLRFVRLNKLSRTDRLMAGFEALALSKSLGVPVDRAKIIHGSQGAAVTVKTNTLQREVGKVVQEITRLLATASPPDLVLNRHCPECEFQDLCRRKAVERNDLSLLSGLTEKERVNLKRKGIFTVHQLSYTFRPRRRARRIANRPEKYSHSLKSLAIREGKTHVVGEPGLPMDGTPVFFDVEGIPDRDFYYLIGIRLEVQPTVVRYHLWANETSEEESIWYSFLDLLSTIDKPILLHYGSFETVFLRKMCHRYGGPPDGSDAARAIVSATNVLSVIFASVYFPTYSNSLKEIARYLGFEWDDSSASGIQSIVWRHQWEESHDSSFREKLVRYNADDCDALSLVSHSVIAIAEAGKGVQAPEATKSEVVRVETLRKNLTSKWRAFESPMQDLVQINEAAHWSYQRDRIFVRSGAAPRTKRHQSNMHRSAIRLRTDIVLKNPEFCPQCGETWPKKGRWVSRKVQDLVFGRDSVKRRLVQYVFRTSRCRRCQYSHGLHGWYQRGSARKWGWNVLAYFVYNAVGLRIPQLTVQRSLNRLFGFDLARSTLNDLKVVASDYYLATKEKILERIIQGDLLHADETGANIKGNLAYVWVLTNLHEVVYILAESREGQFVQELLRDFKGVLVSDFYAAYDAIECRQQKCLIHLMRDLNDEILNNPFDEEMKSIVSGFGSLLKPIVETIDQRGLKKYFLRKHMAKVEKFYRFLDGSDFNSEAASKCKQRFVKNRDKLFTFLRCDGVPWNNNNAEHAIKAFARLRHVISGTSTKKGVDEYLTLLSVAETCEYQGLDFLGFLRSGDKDVATFADRCRRQRSLRLVPTMHG